MFIFEQWHVATGSPVEKNRHILELVVQQVPHDDVESLDIEELRDRIKNVVMVISRYWKNVNRTRRDLIQKYSDWLNIIETVDLPKNKSAAAAAAVAVTSSTKVGRPKKDYVTCSKRTQRRRLAELSQVDNSAVVSCLTHVSSDDTKCEVNASTRYYL